MYNKKINKVWFFGLSISCTVTFCLYLWCYFPQITSLIEGYSDTKVHMVWAQHFFEDGMVPTKTKVYPLYFMSILIFNEIFGGGEFNHWHHPLCLLIRSCNVYLTDVCIAFFSETAL